MNKISNLIISILMVIPFIVLAQSCSGDREETTTISNQSQGKLIITGSSTVAPLVTEIAKVFENQHSDVRIDVQTGGSSRGISDVRKGISDIGMVSRELVDGEKDLYGFAIARDGISIILHKENPVSELTDRQIVDIYTGEAKNWKQFGGKDAPITVVNKSEGRATLVLFLEYFKLKTSEIKPDVIVGDNVQGIKTVSGNPNAIGYVSIGTAEYDSEIGIPIKLLPVGGVEATLQNVSNGSFPLSRPLNLVTKNKPEGLSKKFIEFAQSNKVHQIIKEQYFVPLKN